jgi:aryl-alcohol dehydrogenase-like predicted oxidoreductase
VAIVGTRDSAQVDNAVATADLHLGEDVLKCIGSIMANSVPVSGAAPETV